MSMSDIERTLSTLSGKFLEGAISVKIELQNLRELAIEKYGQLLLIESIQYGSIQGSVGKLRLDKGSINGLSRTVAEVDDILKDREYLDPLTGWMKMSVSNLLFLRKSILGDSSI